MVTVDDILGDMDDMKSALYDITERGDLDDNIPVGKDTRTTT